MNPPSRFLIARDRHGLVVWPRARVALVREEVAGRFEVVFEDGALAHHPGPLEALAGSPLAPVAPAVLVNPRLVSQEGPHLTLPGGWRVENAAPPPPRSPVEPEDPLLEDYRLRAGEVLYLRSVKRASLWVTDRGDVPVNRRGLPLRSGLQASRLHPDLRRAGRLYFVNPLRLRALQRRPPVPFVAVFDNGHELELTQYSGLQLAQSLGLVDADEPAPTTRPQHVLWHLGLRAWPFDLVAAPATHLREEYRDDLERLVGDLAMLTVLAHHRGHTLSFGRSHRAWFYNPVRPILVRAGFWPPPEFALAVLCAPLALWSRVDNDPIFRRMCLLLTRLVMDEAVFTYRELGFREPRAGLRRVGRDHPHVVVVAEKASLEEAVRLLSARFGVGYTLTGGSPAVIATEYFSHRLRRRTTRPIQLVSLCDHDPFGYDIPYSLAAQLRRYHLDVEPHVPRLVRPERFTPHELARIALPIDATSPRVQTRLERWMRETGGTHGHRLAIHADHLRPLDRVLQAFEEELPALAEE